MTIIGISSKDPKSESHGFGSRERAKAQKRKAKEKRERGEEQRQRGSVREKEQRRIAQLRTWNRTTSADPEGS